MDAMGPKGGGKTGEDRSINQTPGNSPVSPQTRERKNSRPFTLNNLVENLPEGPKRRLTLKILENPHHSKSALKGLLTNSEEFRTLWMSMSYEEYKQLDNDLDSRSEKLVSDFVKEVGAKTFVEIASEKRRETLKILKNEYNFDTALKHLLENNIEFRKLWISPEFTKYQQLAEDLRNKTADSCNILINTVGVKAFLDMNHKKRKLTLNILENTYNYQSALKDILENNEEFRDLWMSPEFIEYRQLAKDLQYKPVDSTNFLVNAVGVKDFLDMDHKKREFTLQILENTHNLHTAFRHLLENNEEFRDLWMKMPYEDSYKFTHDLKNKTKGYVEKKFDEYSNRQQRSQQQPKPPQTEPQQPKPPQSGAVSRGNEMSLADLIQGLKSKVDGFDKNFNDKVMQKVVQNARNQLDSFLSKVIKLDGLLAGNTLTEKSEKYLRSPEFREVVNEVLKYEIPNDLGSAIKFRKDIDVKLNVIKNGLSPEDVRENDI